MFEETHSRVRASFFWNSSSGIWLRRFLLRRLDGQKDTVNPAEPGMGTGTPCCSRVLQPLQRLELIKGSSLHGADLVLHQVSEDRRTSGSEDWREDRRQRTEDLQRTEDWKEDRGHDSELDKRRMKGQRTGERGLERRQRTEDFQRTGVKTGQQTEDRRLERRQRT